jgi:hypothetical protein
MVHSKGARHAAQAGAAEAESHGVLAQPRRVADEGRLRRIATAALSALQTLRAVAVAASLYLSLR